MMERLSINPTMQPYCKAVHVPRPSVEPRMHLFQTQIISYLRNNCFVFTKYYFVLSKLLFRNYEIIFRKNEIVFRNNEIVFR